MSNLHFALTFRVWAEWWWSQQTCSRTTSQQISKLCFLIVVVQSLKNMLCKGGWWSLSVCHVVWDPHRIGCRAKCQVTADTRRGTASPFILLGSAWQRATSQGNSSGCAWALCPSAARPWLVPCCCPEALARAGSAATQPESRSAHQWHLFSLPAMSVFNFRWPTGQVFHLTTVPGDGATRLLPFNMQGREVSLLSVRLVGGHH